MMRIDRRSFLRGALGAGAITVGLPLFDALLDDHGTSYATGAPLPVRFGLFTWANGNLPERWTPATTGAGAAWALSDQLAPLLAAKAKLIVATGFDVNLPNLVTHLTGLSGVLTGYAPLNPYDYDSIPLPTLDQQVAAAIGGGTVFRSIEVGARAFLPLSYNGPHAPNPAERSPAALFDRLFGGDLAPRAEAGADPTWRLRRSVLDAVLQDARKVRADLGTRDRQRLEAHLDGVRAIERRLAQLEAAPPVPAVCAPPLRPADDLPEAQGVPPTREVNQLLCELTAMAMACDHTRVVSNAITTRFDDTLFPGASMGHHTLTHLDPGAQDEVHAIVVHLMTCFADMIAAFDAIPEGDGTLLDHMALLATSDQSLGRTHAIHDYPLLIAGSAGGRLRTDQHVRANQGVSTSRVVLSVLRALGVNADGYGEGDNHATDGWSPLEV